MFFLQISIIVMIFTFLPNGETVIPSSSQTTDNMVVQYHNLMSINTGYLHENKKIKKVTESMVTDMRASVYNNLLCSFVFTFRHYMNLIKVLVRDANEDFLKEAFKLIIDEDPHTFQNNIVKMFFVLKHLGSINSLDSLWLMYAYLEYFKTISSEKFIKVSAVVNYDHDIIYGLLSQFTDNRCHPNNMYNHQYSKSKYYNVVLQTVSESDAIYARNTLVDIINLTINRFFKIQAILRLNDNMIFFSTNDLRLPSITLNNDIITTLVTHFVEINLEDEEDEPEIYTRIQNYCKEYRESKPARLLFVRIGDCLRMFHSLIKYIIAINAKKYVLEVQSTLPNIGNQSTDVMAIWILRGNIITTNNMMLNNLKEIISFLKMDDDEELKFVAGIFDSEQLVAFMDPNKNIDNENRINNILEKCTKVLYNNAPSTVISRADLDLSYRRRRRVELVNLARLHEIEVSDLNGYSYEGMLDLFVFKSYIAKLFEGRHLDIAHSFFNFSENFYGAKNHHRSTFN